MPPYNQDESNDDNGNEEWPEVVLSVDVKKPSYTARIAPADPTPVEVELNKSLSAQDLQSIKKKDPFLYYSIPGVREATVRLKSVDMHQLAREGLRTMTRRRASCPACIPSPTRASPSIIGEEPSDHDASDDDEPVTKVTRCTRVSFECHTDLLLDDRFDGDAQAQPVVEMDGFDDSSLEEWILDDFLSKLFALA